MSLLFVPFKWIDLLKYSTELIFGILFAIFAPADCFIGLTFTVSQESPGNTGRRAP